MKKGESTIFSLAFVGLFGFCVDKRSLILTDQSGGEILNDCCGLWLQLRFRENHKRYIQTDPEMCGENATTNS